MARLHVLEPVPARDALWTVARAAGIIGLVALVVTLVWSPRIALLTLWNIAVPLLPATFFLSPALWRGVCPLATLNAWGNRFGTPRPLTERETWWFGVGGLVLFHIIVPARHLALNTDGPMLASTLLAIGAIALVCGALFRSRSAFCNALCPVAPVERLYGQTPLLRLSRSRCATCDVCTPRGCLDLAGPKAMRQLIGGTRDERQWLRTPFGVFAAALPGFIVAHAMLPDTHGSDAVVVYASTIGASLTSYLVVLGTVTVLRTPALGAVAALGAISGALYYWFASATVVAALGAPPVLIPLVRATAIALLTWWMSHVSRPLEHTVAGTTEVLLVPQVEVHEKPQHL
jgi:hypothetical protein